jgi:hypothetical protein
VTLSRGTPCICRTAQLTSRRCILSIYSTNIRTEYLNVLHNLRFFSSKCRLFHSVILFGSCIIHILNIGCAKIRKKILAPKGYTGEKISGFTYALCYIPINVCFDISWMFVSRPIKIPVFIGTILRKYWAIVTWIFRLHSLLFISVP